MAATISQVFYEALIGVFGSNLFLFAFVALVLGVLFLITRQSLASSLVLGVVALDGLNRVANEPYINTLYIDIMIIVAGVIVIAFGITIFKK